LKLASEFAVPVVSTKNVNHKPKLSLKVGFHMKVYFDIQKKERK